jgi:hypothetical protein
VTLRDIPKKTRVVHARWMLFSLEELERLLNAVGEDSVTSPPLAVLYHEIEAAISLRRSQTGDAA